MIRKNASSGKIRILHIITRMIVGGAQQNTLLSVEGLSKSPLVEVDLAYGPELGPEGSLFDQRGSSGCSYGRILVPEMFRRISPVNDLLALIDLYRIIRDGRYDVIHTHSSKAGILGRVAAILCRFKNTFSVVFAGGKSDLPFWKRRSPRIIHTIHGLPFHPYEKRWRNNLYRLVEAVCAAFTDCIVTVANTMATQARTAGVGSRGRYKTIRSGMNTEAFLKYSRLNDDIQNDNESEKESERPSQINRDALGIDENCFVFVKIARLFELKGHEYVFKAISQIKGLHPEVHLLLLGDGLLREELETLAEKLDVKNNITFAGLIKPSEIPAYLTLGDAVVHASLREGLARVIPQGMLAGLPVISFDIDGAREVIFHKKTGLLVKPENVNELMQAMSYVMEHPEAVREMALRAQRICERVFPTSAMVSKLQDLYMDMLWQNCISTGKIAVVDKNENSTKLGVL